MANKNNSEFDSSSSLAVIDELDVKEPSLYKVLIHNDDHTPMDFVVEVIMTYFHKTKKAAVELMLKVHNEGTGLCGVYVKEIAETKVNQVTNAANTQGYPLQCSFEEV